MKHGIGWEILLKGPTKRKGEWKMNNLKRWLSKTDTFTKTDNKEDFYKPIRTDLHAVKVEEEPIKTDEDIKEGQLLMSFHGNQDEAINELDELSVRSDLEN